MTPTTDQAGARERDREHVRDRERNQEQERLRDGSEGEERPAVIRIDRLIKRYGGIAVVDGLSLDVPEGAVFGLLGENGAGKTTTIQILLGLTRPDSDSGRVEVLGLDPTRSGGGLEIRRRVGYVPEVPVLYESMTVAQIGWFASGFHPGAGGSARAFQDRFAELIKGFELPENRKISALSKGMRAKVSLALALAGDPALLILDEPTSGLDALVRREFLESMVDLAGSGKTVLLSSHQIGEVERVASHVALVHQGRLILAEPLEALKARTFLASATFGAGGPPAPPPPESSVKLIDAEIAPRQARWLVHAPSRAACAAALSLPGVENLEIGRPSLEEIYIGCMRARRPDRDATAPPA